MSKYEVRFTEDEDYNFALFAPDGELVDFDYSSDVALIKTAAILNREMENLQKEIKVRSATIGEFQQLRIRLNEKLATLQAALEESQRALATANHRTRVATETAARFEKALRETQEYATGMIGYANSYRVDGDAFEALAEKMTKALSLIDWDYELTAQEIAHAEQVASETVDKEESND